MGTGCDLRWFKVEAARRPGAYNLKLNRDTTVTCGLHLIVEKSIQFIREFGVMYSPPHFLLFLKTTRQDPRSRWGFARRVYIIVYKLESPQPQPTPRIAYNLHNFKKAPKIPQKNEKLLRRRAICAPKNTPRLGGLPRFFIKKSKKAKKRPDQPRAKIV